MGREKAQASAGHVYSLNIPAKLIYMQPEFALTDSIFSRVCDSKLRIIHMLEVYEKAYRLYVDTYKIMSNASELRQAVID